MLQLLKFNKIGQYVQSTTGWYFGCLIWVTRGTQILSKMKVHARHAKGIHIISNFPWSILGSNQYDNACLYLALHVVWNAEYKMEIQENVLWRNKVLHLCVTLLMSWTWYSWSVQLLWLDCCIVSPWPITQFYVMIQRGVFWKFLVIIMYYFWFFGVHCHIYIIPRRAMKFHISN